jgi:phage I-like protein
MLKRFSLFFAWLLLVLMPLQALAAANMLVCNSMMRNSMMQLVTAKSIDAQNVIQQSGEMACHKHVNSAQVDKKGQHKSTCKTNCASLCASLSGMTALTQSTHTAPVLSADKLMSAPAEIYASHTPPKLQRPPILLA